MRRLKVLAGVLAALVVAGCGAAVGEQAGVGRGVRPSASPPYDRNELAAQTKRALMAQDAMNGLAGPVRFAEVLDGDFVTSFYCGVFPKDEGRTGHVGHERQWSTSSLLISNVVHGYYRKTGIEGVDQTRTDLLKRCGSYAASAGQTYTDLKVTRFENVKFELHGPVEFATPDGVEDAIGRCQKEIYPATGQQRIVCAAYLGYKNMVSAVFVSAGLDEPAAKAKLLQIIPTAAAALTAA